MIALGFIFLLVALAASLGFTGVLAARAARFLQVLFLTCVTMFVALALYGLSHPI